MKKILAISSVLLGVIFLAGCGQQPVDQIQPPTPAPVVKKPVSTPPATQQPATDQPVATQPAPTTPSNNIPADWKIYSDATYGFSIQYPPTLITEKDGLQKNEKAAETIAFGKKETENFGGKQTSFVTSDVSLEVFTKAVDIKDIQNTINSGKTDGNEGPQKTYSKITIGGVPALKVMGRGNTQSVDMDVVYFVKESRAFMLSFNFAKTSPDYEENMIASFKFTK